MKTYIYNLHEKGQTFILAEIEAETILEADKKVNELLGIKVDKKPNIGCEIKG